MLLHQWEIAVIPAKAVDDPSPGALSSRSGNSIGQNGHEGNRHNSWSVYLLDR